MQVERKNLIVFVGPEGSGKSDASKWCEKNSNNCIRISTGDILRDFEKNDKTELGDDCRKMFAQHKYLSPIKMLAVIEKRFKEEDVEKSDGIFLDGGLRTVTETLGFNAMLKRTGIDFSTQVIFLRVPWWQCADRLLSENGRKRDDDTPEGWLKRMRKFSRKLNRRTSIIRDRWPLHIIDGNRPKEEVFEDISRRINL